MVQSFSDRVEWVSKVGVSAGKITAGILTAGLSLAVTGLGKGSYGAGGTAGSETISMSAITRVASATNGSRTVVSITTPGGALPMRLTHHDAMRVIESPILRHREARDLQRCRSWASRILLLLRNTLLGRRSRTVR